MQSVDEVREALLGHTTEAADSFELAALSESLGVTDAHALRMGYPNVFALAGDIFVSDFQGQSAAMETVPAPSLGMRAWHELQRFGGKLAIGLGYSLPWILLTAVETFFPHALDVPPAFGSALSLAIIASLITTGGFVQMITRDTTFFLALREPFVARRWMFLIIRYGLISAGLFAVAGCVSSLYFHLFAVHDLVLACAHYVLFSALWMMCATLSAQGLSLTLPFILLGSGAFVFELRLFWHLDAVRVLLAWPILALLAAMLLSGAQTWRAGRQMEARVHSISPSTGTHAYSLLPVYLYGTVYFAFLFLDRLCAGSAVPWTSGLTFGVDPIYKHGMDIALLAFLLCAIAVEYCSDRFMRAWWLTAGASRAADVRSLAMALRRRYSVFVGLIACIFGLLLVAACRYLPVAMHVPMSSALKQVLFLGGAGYLLLATTLFGNIVLLSVNAANSATKAAAIALVVNFLVGYTLSHSVSMQLAAMGLLAGAAVFAWQVHRSVWRVLGQPDYFYSLV